MSDEAFAEYIEPYSLTDVSEFISTVIDAVVRAFNWLSENLRSLWDRVQEELDKIPPPAKKPYLSHRHEKQVFLYKTPYIPRRIYRVQHR